MRTQPASLSWVSSFSHKLCFFSNYTTLVLSKFVSLGRNLSLSYHLRAKAVTMKPGVKELSVVKHKNLRRSGKEQ